MFIIYNNVVLSNTKLLLLGLFINTFDVSRYYKNYLLYLFLIEFKYFDNINFMYCFFPGFYLLCSLFENMQ